MTFVLVKGSFRNEAARQEYYWNDTVNRMLGRTRYHGIASKIGDWSTGHRATRFHTMEVDLPHASSRITEQPISPATA